MDDAGVSKAVRFTPFMGPGPDHMRVTPRTSCLAARGSLRTDLLLIAALWCVSLMVVNPLGNFPLNDDWSYGLTVKHLVETGEFRPTGWTSMPLLTNALWGSVFCLPAGFSFNALRLSTLTLSLGGVVGVFVLMRNLGASRWLAYLVALTVAFNPIYYSLANTFLTDVPFAALTMVAALFLVRSLKTEATLDLLVGTTVAVAATLSRQLGMAVPLAFAVTLILKGGIRAKNLIRAVLPAALCLGALYGFQHWLKASGRLPALYYAKNDDLLNVLLNPDWFFRVVSGNAYVVLLYLGLFLSPVLLWELASVWACHKKKAIAIFAASFAAMAVGGRVLYGPSATMPLLGRNIVDQSGIGPFTLRDTYVLNNPMPVLPASFWRIITGISVLGAALLITVSVISAIHLAERARSSKMNDRDGAATLLLLSAVIYLLPLLIAPSTNPLLDRYLIPLVPLVAVGIASVISQFPPIRTRGMPLAAVTLLSMLAFFAICGTRDYLAWNRVRWAAVGDLMKGRQVTAEEIDGGFEFNGLNLYDPKYQRGYKKSWWWVHEDRYVIAFRPLPGYRVVQEYDYHHWMPRYIGKVDVLEREPLETTKR
jgi:hypothetical protein